MISKNNKQISLQFNCNLLVKEKNKKNKIDILIYPRNATLRYSK